MVGLIALAFAACSKEKSVDTTEDGGPGVFRMKVDGTQWNATTAIAASIKDGVIILTGTSADKKTLYLELDNTTAITYDLDQNSGSYATYLDQNESAPTPYATDEGQSSDDAGGPVVVTKIDATNKRISGTFSFRMFRDIDSKQVIVTEGVFENLTYTTDGTNPGPGTGSGSLSAKINGTAFTGDIVTAIANGPMIMISGTKNDATAASISLIVPVTVATGTYSFDASNYSGNYGYLNGTTPVAYMGMGPEIVITEHNTTNKTLKGTFKINGTEMPPGTGTVTITDGSFSVTYQ